MEGGKMLGLFSFRTHLQIRVLFLLKYLIAFQNCLVSHLLSLTLTGFQTLLGLSIWIQRECIYQLIYLPTS